MPRDTLLIVEDDVVLNNRLAHSFRKRYRVHQATTLSGAEAMIEDHYYQPYDLIVLDRSLQDDDGLDLLPLITNETPSTKVCVLSARTEEAERVRGLSYGADDYLIKPFCLAELSIRLQNLLRRGSAYRFPQVQYADLALQEDNRLLLRGDQRVHLTKQQAQYLHTFMTQPAGLAYSHRLASYSLSKPAPLPVSAVHMNVQRLRKKIAPLHVDITNHYGLGYQLVIEPAEKPL